MTPPTHLMVPVDKKGNGPCAPDQQWGYRCWCAAPDCKNVQHVLTDDGGNLCDEQLAAGNMPPPLRFTTVRPGFCADCHAYTEAIVYLLAKYGEAEA